MCRQDAYSIIQPLSFNSRVIMTDEPQHNSTVSQRLAAVMPALKVAQRCHHYSMIRLKRCAVLLVLIDSFPDSSGWTSKPRIIHRKLRYIVAKHSNSNKKKPWNWE